MHEELVGFINSKVSGANAVLNKAEVGDSSITINADKITHVCKTLRDSDAYLFNVLQVISGVDFLEGEGQTAGIEIVYVLASYSKNLELLLKVKLPRGSAGNYPEIDSVTSIWEAANFQERETYDMFGVNFKGHPDLRRILLPQDWEGYPLRKDYEAQKIYRSMEVYPEDKLNLNDQNFGAKTQGTSVSNKDPMKTGRYS